MKTIIAKYSAKLNFPLDDADLNQILVYLENRQIRKLQFEYGDTIIAVCLDWAETKEDYELCSVLKKFQEEIKKYNA